MIPASLSRTRATRALVILTTIGLAACSGSTATGSPAASTAVVASVPPSASAIASTAASPTDTPAPSSQAPSQAAASSGPSAVPTSIDPCQLVPAQEASTLTGVSFGAGKEETTSGNGRMCIYGYQTKNVFEVIVAVAPDVATAKAEEVAAQAQLQKNAAQTGQGLNITQLPGFASGADAVLLELKPNPYNINGRAIYVLRGTVFFGFSDLVVGGSAPSADAMKAEANTVLGRLP